MENKQQPNKSLLGTETEKPFFDFKGVEKRQAALEAMKGKREEYEGEWAHIGVTGGAQDYYALAEDKDGFTRWLKEYQEHAIRSNSLHKEMAEEFKELTGGEELTGMRTVGWVPEDALKATYERTNYVGEYERARSEILAREYKGSPNLSGKVGRPDELVQATAESYKGSLREARKAQASGIPTEYVQKIRLVGEPHLRMYGIAVAALENNDTKVAAKALTLAERINPDVPKTVIERCKIELQKKDMATQQHFAASYKKSKKEWETLFEGITLNRL